MLRKWENWENEVKFHEKQIPNEVSMIFLTLYPPTRPCFRLLTRHLQMADSHVTPGDFFLFFSLFSGFPFSSIGRVFRFPLFTPRGGGLRICSRFPNERFCPCENGREAVTETVMPVVGFIGWSYDNGGVKFGEREDRCCGDGDGDGDGDGGNNDL